MQCSNVKECMSKANLPESWAVLCVCDKTPHNGQLAVLSVS